MKGNESAPDDIDSIQKLKEYSEKFEAGQTGILLINNQTEREKPAAKDLDVLDVINWTQGEINNLSVEKLISSRISVALSLFVIIVI